MNKGLRTFGIVVVLAACIGLGAYLAVNQRPQPKPSPPPPSHPVKKPAEAPTKVKTYRVAVENNRTVLRPTEIEVKAGEDPAEGALKKLIEQGDSADLANPIPKGTRLLSFKFKDDLVTVDFSREFKDNFTGGSAEEGATIGAILKTLGQFPKIKRVEFFVEGKPLDTLGHLDLSGPQDVQWVGSEFGGEN